MTATVNASTSAGVIVTSDTSGALALQTAGTTALTISSAQVVNFANAPTVAGSPIGSSQATATVLGTVYAKQTTGGGSPYLTAVGYNAGVSTTGLINTAFGHQALYTNTTGTAHVAIGYNSLYNSNGDNNVAIGVNTLYSTTTGTSNTAIGYSALYSNTTGSNSTAVGVYALYSNNNATNPNTAVGFRCLYSNTSGYSNVAVGVYTMNSTTSGTNNVAMGRDALYYNTSGSYNVAIGDTALISNTTASYNTAVGYQASRNITTGTENTMLGYGAGYNTSTGSYNVLIGTSSGGSLTTGGSNVIIGRTSGVSLVDGTNNIYIGYASYASGASSGSETVIGFNITGKGNNTSIIANPCYQGNNSSSWSTTSDRRLKKNIVDNTIGLDAINAIQVRNFEYRTEDEITELPKNAVIKKEGVQIGAIAQELQQVLPDCVKTESTGVMSVDTTNITWHLINAVKELSAELNALKAKVGV